VPRAARPRCCCRFLCGPAATGGCALPLRSASTSVKTRSSPLAPLPAFSALQWTVPSRRRVVVAFSQQPRCALAISPRAYRLHRNFTRFLYAPRWRYLYNINKHALRTCLPQHTFAANSAAAVLPAPDGRHRLVLQRRQEDDTYLVLRGIAYSAISLTTFLLRLTTRDMVACTRYIFRRVCRWCFSAGALEAGRQTACLRRWVGGRLFLNMCDGKRAALFLS